MPKTRFHSMLEAKIQEVIVNRTENLAGGMAKSMEEYKYYVGNLDGLRDALKFCDEINEEFDK